MNEDIEAALSRERDRGWRYADIVATLGAPVVFHYRELGGRYCWVVNRQAVMEVYRRLKRKGRIFEVYEAAVIH